MVEVAHLLGDQLPEIARDGAPVLGHQVPGPMDHVHGDRLGRQLLGQILQHGLARALAHLLQELRGQPGRHRLAFTREDDVERPLHRDLPGQFRIGQQPRVQQQRRTRRPFVYRHTRRAPANLLLEVAPAMQRHIHRAVGRLQLLTQRQDAAAQVEHRPEMRQRAEFLVARALNDA
jgi:hypothetical protein